MAKLDVEHGIYCYYGRLGQGKTYAMVRDLFSALNNGYVVYSNFTIHWNGFDERNDKFLLFLASIGLKKNFIRFPASNLRFLRTDDNWHDEFAKIRNAIVAVDEAYALFDSYKMAKIPMEQRLNILQCRKHDVSVWYTTQRPTAVHVYLRGMTNVFYRCEKWNVPFLTLFARDEFDLNSDDSVDMDNRLGRKLYLGRQVFYQMYNTKETVGIKGEVKHVEGRLVEKEQSYEIICLRIRDVWAALAAHVWSKIRR